MTSLRMWILSGVAVVSVSGCARHDNSGIFVAKDANAVTLMQLVETPDRKVSGRLEVRHANLDGSIGDDVLVVEGSASDEQMSLLFHPSWMQSGYSATAQEDGDALTVTSRGRIATLQRSSLKNYAEDVEFLNRHASELRAQAQKAAADGRTRFN